MGEASQTLHVGTYAKTGGAGLISVVGDDGGWRIAGSFPAAPNASFGVYSRRFDRHFLVNEQSSGALGAFRYGAAGWQSLGGVATQGAEPCYVALDAAETCLAVANYGSGTVALFRLEPESCVPIGPLAMRSNRGTGPVGDRQEGPHAHCALFAPDGGWLYHVDLGTDQILAHRFDPETVTLGTTHLAYQAPAGSGPRHLTFHPERPIALLVSELASTVTLLERSEGRFTARRTLSTLPSDFSSESLGGHLALNRAGDRVYVTNRGHDSIAVFALDSNNDLRLLQHQPSGGHSPRQFVLIEDRNMFALVNEESGNLVLFGLAGDGTLTPAVATLDIPGAAFVFAT